MSERTDFYRGKAAAALKAADAASSPEIKETWIRLSLGWTQLAEQTERVAKYR